MYLDKKFLLLAVLEKNNDIFTSLEVSANDNI